jgi:hypothetical protein
MSLASPYFDQVWKIPNKELGNQLTIHDRLNNGFISYETKADVLPSCNLKTRVRINLLGLDSLFELCNESQNDVIKLPQIYYHVPTPQTSHDYYAHNPHELISKLELDLKNLVGSA